MKHPVHIEYPINQVGRDYVIGDLHGCYDELFKKLEEKEFHFENDRLFAVGDIIDRGKDCLKCLKLIREPWFNTVQGNHEDMMLSSILDGYDGTMWLDNGGMWAVDVLPDTLWELCNEVRELPYAITINTLKGRVGICHAQPPTRNWQDVEHPTIHDVVLMQWGRTMANMARTKGHAAMRTKIANVDQVYCGHSVFPEVTEMGNITFLDTGAGFDWGRLTILEI